MFLIFRDSPAAFPESFELSAEEYRHLRARRLQSGAAVQVGDGRGRRLAYRLAYEQGAGTARVHRGDAPIEIGNEASVELFTAVPEGKRWDWLLQKATELGATRIQPIVTQHSEARKLKREREERIILEAAVQSRRYILPVLGDALPLARVLDSEASLRLALDPRGDDQFVDAIAPIAGGENTAQIFIGPEGGFSERELEDFIRAGGLVCRLGAAILRIETAALAALACCAGAQKSK